MGNRKIALGFAPHGFIYLLRGNQNLYEEWAKATKAVRYHNTFKWFIPSSEEIPSDLPSGLEVVRFEEDKVFQEGTDELLPMAVIESNVASLLTDKSYFGDVGTRYDLTLTLVKTLVINTRYGEKRFHIFVDSEDNEFTWTTTTTKEITAGECYRCRGTVKAHTIYQGKKQTELSRMSNFSRI